MDANQVEESLNSLLLLSLPVLPLFPAVSKAFTILTDKDKRAAYDRFGGDPDSRFGSASAAAGAGARGPRTAQFGGDEIDPRDLFEMFFGGGGGGMGGGEFSRSKKRGRRGTWRRS